MPFDAQMQHLNGDVLCAVNIRTTGEMAGYHDVIRLSIIVVDNFIRPTQTVIPFDLEIVPRRPENIKDDSRIKDISKHELYRIGVEGTDADLISERFETWVTELGLAFRKKVVPLVFDWSKTSRFLIDLLGFHTYNDFFSKHARDVMIIAQYANDKCNMRMEPVQYPKYNFAYLCSQLKIDRERGNDCLQDCLALIEIYKRMLQQTF